MWFWWRESSIKHIFFFAEGYCWSQGADITMKDFSTFINTRRCKNWIHKIISWKYLSEDLLCKFFSEHKCNSFLISSMNSLQGVLKVSSCEAYNFILVKADGKCQFVDGNGFKKEMYCLSVLKARGPRSRFQLIRFLVRNFFLGYNQPPFSYIPKWPFLSACMDRENVSWCLFL